MNKESFSFKQNYRSLNIHVQRGISLIEIMIAMVIDLLLLIAITAFIINQSNLSNELYKSSRQMENGRYAMFLLQQDINLAGFYGAWEPPITHPSALPDPCSITPTTSDLSLVIPIQGYDNPSAKLSCMPDHKSGTDILVVRRVATSGPITAPVSNEIYLQAGSASEASPFDPALGIQNADIQIGDPSNFGLGSLNSDNSINTVGTKADGTTASIFKKANVSGASLLNNNQRIAADINKYHVHIYFISPCSIATGTAVDTAGINKACLNTDDNGNPIPTLKRLELTVVNGNRQFKEVPLVEGIDNLQLDYAIDRDLDGAPDSTSIYRNSDNTYLAAPGLTDWNNVMVVRVNILSRNLERPNNEATGAFCRSTNPPPQCSTVYYLGLNGNVGPFTDDVNGGYKRHVYTQSVLVVNPVKRRQQ